MTFWETAPYNSLAFFLLLIFTLHVKWLLLLWQVANLCV